MSKIQYSRPGPSKLRRKESFGQEIKSIAKIMGGDILPHITLPRQKRPYKPRPNAQIPHKQEEKKLERKIINYLRAHGCYCGKMEPSIGGRSPWNKGIPDIMCFTPNHRLWFIEVKTEIGFLSKEQIKWEELCFRSHTGHIVARKISDCFKIIDISS